MTYLALGRRYSVVRSYGSPAPREDGKRRMVCRGRLEYRMALSWRHRAGAQGGRWWRRPGCGRVVVRLEMRGRM